MVEKALRTDRLLLGVCYYPEQWDEALWDPDFRRMREMGLSIIRVGEFAWSIFEPVPGRFSFALFDRALDLAHQHGLLVVLGTPTATPPAWLTHAHPEVLNVTREGLQYQHGQRRHYNYNAPVYRELASRIVARLAEHYRDHPTVVGWQIDNEINCETNVFYSAADHTAFRAWLQARYGSLDALNAAWGTVFWSQTYTDWQQVYLTRPTVSNSPNPHQLLDEKRFISDSGSSFVELQASLIRTIAPRHWITTNGIFGHLDSHAMTRKALDFISYDSYPNFSTIWPDGGAVPGRPGEQGAEALLDRKWSLNLSIARDISPRFCVMEQQAGAGGWVNRMAAPSPRPGQLRLWTYQSVAHGADAVLYFRWRTATAGTEIYWHGLNDYHNRPNRRVQEAARVGAEFARIGALVAGSRFRAEVALLRDYDNEWDGEFDVWYGPLQRQSELAWFRALQYRHIPVDLLNLRLPSATAGGGAGAEAAGSGVGSAPPTGAGEGPAAGGQGGIQLDDLRRYTVLIYPHPAMMREQTAALLAAYVAQGGTIIFGCRTGYKDERGHCRMIPMPGPVAGLCGVEVEDFTLIGAASAPPTLEWLADAGARSTPAEGFNDILAVTAPDAQVLACYAGDCYYAGAPAVIRRPAGAGAAYYFGAQFDGASANNLIDLCGLRSPADGVLTLPREVELCIREQEGGTAFWFLLNYAHRPQTIAVQGSVKDLLTDTMVGGTLAMEPFGVFILAMP